jgi:hypothetical protein
MIRRLAGILKVGFRPPPFALPSLEGALTPAALSQVPASVIPKSLVESTDGLLIAAASILGELFSGQAVKRTLAFLQSNVKFILEIVLSQKRTIGVAVAFTALVLFVYNYFSTAKDVQNQVEKRLLTYTEQPEEFICPITMSVMNDPVILPSGHSYEREAIEQWVQAHQTDPLTMNAVTLEEVRPNRALKTAIERWSA